MRQRVRYYYLGGDQLEDWMKDDTRWALLMEWDCSFSSPVLENTHAKKPCSELKDRPDTDVSTGRLNTVDPYIFFSPRVKFVDFLEVISAASAVMEVWGL